MDGRYAAWKGWKDERFGELRREVAAYFAAELAACGHRTLTGKTVLEIGFGNGEFAAWSGAAGASWHGVEADAQRIARARAHGLAAHPSDGPLDQLLPHGTCDLVVAFDVIEHLPLAEIERLLAEVHGVLKPGSCLLLRTPSGDSPYSGAVFNGDVTHQTLLGSQAVRQLAAYAGFSEVEVREPALPLRGVGPGQALRRALVKLVRALCFPLIRALFMGGSQAVLTPNLIAVLRK